MSKKKAHPKAAKPKKLKVEFPSTSLKLTIVAAPLRLLVQTPVVSALQGTTIEVPVEVTRLFGYKGPVEVESVLPKGTKGVTPAKLTVPDGETTAVLKFDATPDATVGSHRVELKAKVKWNGQDLETAATFSLQVEKFVPAEQTF